MKKWSMVLFMAEGDLPLEVWKNAAKFERRSRLEITLGGPWRDVKIEISQRMLDKDVYVWYTGRKPWSKPQRRVLGSLVRQAQRRVGTVLEPELDEVTVGTDSQRPNTAAAPRRQPFFVKAIGPHDRGLGHDWRNRNLGR